jgi:hypothetical protein
MCFRRIELHAWLTTQFAKLSRNHDLAKAINYMLRRWDALTRFLDDGRICITNNAAERALRWVPLGRKAWLFCGSDRGGECAAIIYTLIHTAKLNNVDPQAWLADVLARIANQSVSRLYELLPWNWNRSPEAIAARASAASCWRQPDTARSTVRKLTSMPSSRARSWRATSALPPCRKNRPRSHASCLESLVGRAARRYPRHRPASI